ncbi:calcium-binding protein [Nocardioides pacificus]
MAGVRRTALAIAALVLSAVPAGAVSSQPQARTCPDIPATITGTPGDDRLVGTPGDDVIHGLGGHDTLLGGGGNDIMCGGPGSDVLRGGAGDDQLHGETNGLRQPYPDNPPDNVGDTLVPGPGDDVVVPGHDVSLDEGGGFTPDSISLLGAPGGVRVDLGAGTASGEGSDRLLLDGRVTVIGSDHDDVLVGSAERDELVGGLGDDELHGLEGDDRLEADPESYGRSGRPHGDDRVYGGEGDDRVYGGEGDDSLQLGDGHDLARGGPGADLITHGSGRVDVHGGAGRDNLDLQMEFAAGQLIDGGTGKDELYLWSITDDAGTRVMPRGRIDLRSGRIRMALGDRVRVGRLARIERLRAPDGVWTVLGTPRDETFYGSMLASSRLVVRARGGNDVVSGTPGDDVLDGGPGRDRVSDDRGRDTCLSFERYYGGQRCEINR